MRFFAIFPSYSQAQGAYVRDFGMQESAEAPSYVGNVAVRDISPFPHPHHPNDAAFSVLARHPPHHPPPSPEVLR